MKQLTQHDIVFRYLKNHKTITPAKMVGRECAGGFCGSDFGRRCRELRALGILESMRETNKQGSQSKFVSFYLI